MLTLSQRSSMSSSRNWPDRSSGLPTRHSPIASSVYVEHLVPVLNLAFRTMTFYWARSWLHYRSNEESNHQDAGTPIHTVVLPP